MKTLIYNSLTVERHSISDSKHYFPRKFVLIFFLILAYCANAQTVQRINPRHTANALYKSFFVNHSTGYIVGYYGTILKTNDGGESWTDISLCSQNRVLQDVVFISPDTGFICGWGIFLKTVDGGNNWSKIEEFDDHYDYGWIGFIGHDTGYLIGAGNISGTIDRGRTWQGAPGGVYGDELYAATTAGNHVFVATQTFGGPAYLYRLTAGEAAWQKSEYILNDIDFYNSNIGAFLWYWPQTVYITDDGGDHWNKKQLDILWSINQLLYCGNDKYIASGYESQNNPAIFINTNNEDWKKVKSLPGDRINHFNFLDSLTGFAVGAGGMILKTIDGGYNWSLYDENTTITYGNLLDGTFIDNKNGIIAGNGILSTNDGGQTWSKLNDSIFLASISFPTKNIGYGCYFDNSTGYRFLKTTNGGITWFQPDTTVFEYLKDVCFINADTGFVCGYTDENPGSLLKTTDGGLTWNEIDINGNKLLGTVYFINDNEGFALGSADGSIYRTNDGGISWENNLLAEQPFTSISFNDELNGYICGNGNVFKTTDGGISWSKILEDQTMIFQDVYFKNDTCFIYGYKYSFSNTVLMISTDGGEIWNETKICNVPLFKLIPKNNNTLFLIGEGGSIIRIDYDAMNGIIVEKTENDLLITPNPVISCLQISEKLTAGTIIRIFDINGKQVYEKTTENDQNLIDVSNLPAGVFIIQAINKEQNLISKFVKM